MAKPVQAESEEVGDIVFDPEENLDMPMSVPSDAILEEVVPDIPDDPYLFVRTRSKRALIEEAKTLRHRMSHYPHNPYCQECIKANMRQRRYAHKGERADDGLPTLTAPRQQFSTDFIIISKSSSDMKKIGRAHV